jgi:signal transduction histidine kinase
MRSRIAERSDGHAAAPVELRLAASRAVLAIVSLIAVYLDSTEPSRFTTIAYILLVGYSIHSAAVLALLWRKPGLAPALGVVLHWIDVIWAALLTVVSQGPSSPFFPLFVFVLLAAAYRWGFRITLITGGCTIGLLALEAVLIWTLSRSPLEFVELNRLIIRCAYLLLVAYLAGYLAETEKQLRTEASAIAEMTGMARIEPGLSASMQAVFGHLLEFTAGREAVFVFHESATARTYLWNARRDGGAPPTPFHWREISSEESRRYMLPLPSGVHAIEAVRGVDGRVRTQAVDASGQPARLPENFLFVVPDTFGEWRALMCFCIFVGEEPAARLFLRRRNRRPVAIRELASLQRIVRQVFPALYSVYLLRRLRTRAGAIERSRVARELHDGVIQSLMGLEMQLTVARKEAGELPQQMAGKLEAIEGHLHEEVLNVRDLMQQMRPVDADARNLLEIMSDLVERFRRETGVEARFVSELEEVDLAPRTCRELARIVQEALVNVRRHSAASNVVVRFGTRNDEWLLEIDDDGRGFDFAGRVSHAVLESRRKGPIVIKERVRTIGGTLAIESTPGRGSRLEITLPRSIRHV